MSVQASVATVAEATEALEIVPYSGEAQLPDIQSLIDQDLSEPYSVFTYRYFLNQWPHLCYLAMVPSGRGSDSGEGGDKQGAEAAEASARTAAKTCVGTVVCKLDMHKNGAYRGYIAMLAVRKDCRGSGLGTRLVRAAIRAMARDGCDEVVLEAEITNTGALRLYEQLGFIRDKLLEKYYLNGNGAYRLKLRLKQFRPNRR